MELQDFRTPNAGQRAGKYVAIISTACCVNVVCHRIKKLIRGTKVFPRSRQCPDAQRRTEQLTRVLIGLCRKPYVAGVLLVGFGCEIAVFERVLDEIGRTGKPVDFIAVHQIDGMFEAVNQGAKIAADIVLRTIAMEKEKVGLGPWTAVTECGSSGTNSGPSSMSGILGSKIKRTCFFPK